ncbi:GNAT family N-acetyltransferase [Billgrantia pellis]|uniref:GNAT family N-acetyltransferase n=1 Tax=Billgrantia pellis TaxID=2606936 RepID=A0A7V7G0V0_9GAMM|nr:GNAT family N-acetyltransferase [Halomonas pellis]KAA0013140.1 GNAT family N-acetyltransferase [Halomonas pellis]
MTTIRTARGEDYAPLFALYRELNPEDPAPSDDTRRVFERILRSPDLVLVVAELNRALVATCYLSIMLNLTRGAQPYALIENVVTHPHYRGQGIGKQLIRHALEHAWSRGCYKVMLLTGSEEASTHAFYRACGFSGEAKHGYVIRRG